MNWFGSVMQFILAHGLWVLAGALSLSCLWVYYAWAFHLRSEAS